jgi:hypothetical protein
MSNIEHNLKIINNFWSFDKNELTYTNPILEIIKIKKFLGKGLYKKAFLLENDNVFSIFEEGHMIYGEEEVEKFKKLQNALFTGTASKHEPMIYDTGTLFQFEDEYERLYFVEMGFVKMLKEWCETHNVSFDVLQGILDLIHRPFFKYQDQGIKFGEIPFENFVNIPFQKNKNLMLSKMSRARFSFEQYKLLMWCFYSILKNNPTASPDFHAGNIGVLPSTIEEKLPVFVVFDF